MTSASVAVKRLQSESLQQKSLNELKQDAAELGLSKEDVKQFGSLTYKQTWLTAIGVAIANEFDGVETEEDTPIEPVNDPNPETAPGEVEQLPFETEPTPVEPSPVPDAQPQEITTARFPVVKFNGSGLGQHHSDTDFLSDSPPIPVLIPLGEVGKKILTLTEPSTTPMLDKLVQKAVNYIDNGITAQDFELLKSDPPDEYTAAIYLGWLEESEQILTEALAA